jgi:hypothetical protein
VVARGVTGPMNAPANPETRLRDVDWLAVEQRRQIFLDFYLLAIEACLRSGGKEWWRHAFAYDRSSDYASSMPLLTKFCVQGLLYEAGDIWTFAQIYEGLEQAGIVADDEWGRFALDLARYVRDSLVRAEQATAATVGHVARARRMAQRGYDTLARKLPAVVSVVILDGVSLDKFFEFCISSLASERNLKALAKQRSVRLHVFGRDRDLPGIERRVAELSLGCTIVCQAIPEDLAVRAEGVAGPQSDWLIGALQCLHLLDAKRLRADFHAINPNALYADGYFEAISRLRREGKKAVLAATLYTEPNAVRSHLAPFWVDKDIAIPAIELAKLSLHALSPGNGLKVVQDLGWLGGAASHLQLVWERRDGVEIHSTQHELAFLSYRLLDALPDRFFMKPSAEIDRMLTATTQPHFVSEADSIVLLDLSNRKTMIDGEKIDLAGFASSLAEYARTQQLAHFRQAVRFSVDRAEMPDRPWRQDAEVATEQGMVFKVLDEAESFAAPKGSQALTALGVLHQYEMSEYALDDMAGIIAEGRRLLASIRPDADMKIAIRRDLVRAAMNFDYVTKAVELAEGGGESTVFIRDFLAEMTRLKAANQAHAERLRSAFGRRRFAVIGAIAWGERFVDKFVNYCLASLLADGNIPALARKGAVVLSIVTTEADRDRMTAHPAIAHLRQSAEVVFTCFPAEFLEQREKDGLNFYHFYGLLDHQSVFLAVALQADLYLLPIDCVYSSDCLKTFSGYLDKEADCCSVGAIETEEPVLRAWLDADGRRRSGVLDLAAKELIEAASRHPDRYFRSMIMNPDNAEFCAHPRELVWPFADGLGIHSVFMHPLAVSARLLTRPFHPHHENVDYALLPRLLQGDGRMKVIEDASKAVLAHFGAPVTRNEFLPGAFSIKSFIEAHRYDYAVHRRFFDTRQFFPCRDVPYAPSTDYAAELALIQSALERNRFSADHT